MSKPSRQVELVVHTFTTGGTGSPYLHDRWNWESIPSRQVELGVHTFTTGGTRSPYFHDTWNWESIPSRHVELGVHTFATGGTGSPQRVYIGAQHDFKKKKFITWIGMAHQFNMRNRTGCPSQHEEMDKVYMYLISWGGWDVHIITEVK